MTARVLMVQGTSSSVGKTLLVTALCRILRQQGFRVAPFKAQNMSLNAAVTADGLEIGRSTAVQAAAAGIEPSVDMNPILLKPESDVHSQLIVLGRVRESLPAQEYFQRKEELWAVVAGALDRLRSRYEVIVLEGAGSPAEVSLRATDIVNMRVALHCRAPVLLAGDIDRGGVFASLIGTLVLLSPEERALVKGFLINKFRGDRALLEPGLTFLSERTGVPVAGVIPYLRDLRIAEEDGVALEQRVEENGAGPLTIAVIRLPHIANFDDFDLLAAEPAIHLHYVEQAAALGKPDLVIVPGSKATMADLTYLRERGLAARLVALAQAGTPILGICGGYQMLGQRLLDPLAVESSATEMPGLGLLPAQTTFQPEKRTTRVKVLVTATTGCLGGLTNHRLAGYEIHTGTTVVQGLPLFAVTGDDGTARAEGCISADGLIAGTYVHGLFETAPVRFALTAWLAGRRGLILPASDAVPTREEEYDRLAASVRSALDWSLVAQLLRDQDGD